ncbi:hypothetical protein LOTGIDRAFT_237739 [Lottia gigantea]|uniref:Uncharacterized protein n=1 Tax=Lottia gigantea TaxID=225164 RepID=V4AZY5_LOTGI|nr:hypothetical protein LOTGIDRAFT_237739 [Lottia gigantea]ESP03303.1 hypothetical protein LOTGIDRAFT_237739 [Lottia gigantea]
MSALRAGCHENDTILTRKITASFRDGGCHQKNVFLNSCLPKMVVVRKMSAFCDSRLVLAMDIPPPTQNRLVKTALHQAVLDCRLHQVRLLVSKHNVNIDSKDVNGRTPLMLTCFIENEDLGFKMAKIFLAAGSFMNIKDTLGRTALGYACLNGKEKIVNKILSEDILDINEPDNDGNTPLHHSCYSGNPRIVAMLANTYLRFGINIDRRNNLGYTALLIACKNGYYASAHMLLTKCRASPTLKDNEFYLNAGDWTKRSYEIKMKGSNHSVGNVSYGNRIAQQFAISFARQEKMYGRCWTPLCRHGTDTVSMSLDSSLRLPNICQQQYEKNLDENIIDGEDARRLLLNEIHETESSRPKSDKHASVRWAMGQPSTAKLRSLSVSKPNTRIPDMMTIFKAYSEQYQPDWRQIQTDTGSHKPSDVKADNNPTNQTIIKDDCVFPPITEPVTAS